MLGTQEPLSFKGVSGPKCLVPTNILQDGLDPEVEEAFAENCQYLSRLGVELEARAVPELDEIQTLYARYGSFASHESYALYEEILQGHGDEMDSRVVKRIMQYADMPAKSYIRLHVAREAIRRSFWQRYRAFDAILAPTVPILPPAIASLKEDAEFFRVNGLCLRNTMPFNFLGTPAVSVPVKRDMPIGLMIVTRPYQEALALNLARVIEIGVRGY
ncbi:MAG: amidase family protein [Deinococcales bacterium]